MLPDSIALTFTAHNIVLPDGSETLPGKVPVADDGITRAALRDLSLAFPGVPRDQVRVADLGCLEGGHSAAMAQAGYDVTGFEVRAENILCCRYAAERMGLPNLRYVQADVRDVVTGPDEWDAVFCCGLLYHLGEPVSFLRDLGRATRKLVVVQTHYSTRPDSVHEGHQGHWYEEGTGRWESWKNDRSFWLTRLELLSVMRASGFDAVFEQLDYLENILDGRDCSGPDERSMFVGMKT